MKTEKIYGILKTRKDRDTRVIGTLDYLINSYFGYTLECGKSWNDKIKWKSDIKTFKSLLTNLQKSYEETEAACYERTMIQAIEPTTEEIAKWNEEHQPKPAVMVNIIIVSEPDGLEEDWMTEDEKEFYGVNQPKKKRKMTDEDWDDMEEQDAFDRECNG